MKRHLRVTVSPGIFSCERYVEFVANSQCYGLFVDPSFLNGDLVQVRVVAEGSEDAIVDLPNETWTTGNRIRLSQHLLLDCA